MPVVPILLTDTQKTVEYKLFLFRNAALRTEEASRVRMYRDYYKGDHELLLSDDQRAFLKGVISDDDKWPVDNKCLTVVRKIKGRLEVEGFRDSQGRRLMIEDADGDPEEQMNTEAQATAQAQGVLQSIVGWWVDNGMERWEPELYKSALRDGEAYIIVDHDGQKPRFTWIEKWDGDTGVYMVYEDPVTKLRPLMAIRYWWAASPLELDAGSTTTSGGSTQPTTANAGWVQRVTVYTASAVYKYAHFADRRQQQYYNVVGPMTDDGFYPIKDPNDAQWPVPWVDKDGQPLGLAVAPFITPDGSVIEPIIGLNNALNKANLDILAAADQMGFGVLVTKYETMPPLVDDPTTGQDGLGLRPGRMLETTGDVSKIPADDMGGLLDVARHWVQSIAANSDIPVYEFTPTLTEVPSGNALQMLDESLARRAQECIHSYNAAWRAVLLLAQRLDVLWGDMAGDPVRVSPVWGSTRRETTETQMAQAQLDRVKQNAQRDQQSAQQADAIRRAGGVMGIAERLRMMGQANGSPTDQGQMDGMRGGQ